MRWTADKLKSGQGPLTVMREAVTTQALNQLRDQLKEIQGSMGQGQQAASDKDRQALEQALAQTERLRKQMEQGSRSLPGQKAGQQAGGQQPGGRQPGGQQPGEDSEGQPGQTGQSGQIGGRANGRQAGDWQGGPGPAWGDAGAFVRNYQNTLRDLEDNPQVSRDMRDMIHDLYRLDPRLSPGNPEMMSRIEAQMLTGVEQIELQLRRSLDGDQGGVVRSGTAEPVPPGYADAVAEYFRRLSKGK